MPSSYKISWSKEANQNLDSIIEYLEFNWTKKQTTNFFEKLEKRLVLISKNPQSFPALEFNKSVRKSVLTTQTSIFYEIKNEEVVILFLFDNRQNPDTLKII
jgi:plasmid stabilization system protein ParE